MSFVLGLTGGVASGKSLVAASFRTLGVPVLDADQVSREVVQPGEPALTEIASAFGAQSLLPDGTLDRAHLRRVVFADADARRKLEAITHPRIRARIAEWLAAQTAPYCVLENAILFESGMDALVDRVLLVDVPEDVQRARLATRDGSDPALIERMLAAQMPRAERLRRAQDVLDNTGTKEALERAVAGLHRGYLQRTAEVSQRGR